MHASTERQFSDLKLMSNISDFSCSSGDRTESRSNHITGGCGEFVNACADISAIDRNHNILATSTRQILLGALERCGNYGIWNFGIFLRIVRKPGRTITSDARRICVEGSPAEEFRHGLLKENASFTWTINILTESLFNSIRNEL